MKAQSVKGKIQIIKAIPYYPKGSCEGPEVCASIILYRADL